MKKIVVWVLAAAMGFGLSGCSVAEKEQGADLTVLESDGTTEPADKTEPAIEAQAEPVEIVLMHDEAEEDRIASLQIIIDAFETENPGIKVIQQPVSEDAFDTNVKTLISAGQLPALVTGSNTLMQMLDEEGVSNTAANKEVFDGVGADAFYDSIPAFLNSQNSGGMIGVPVTGWVSGVWYRTDIFAEKGLEAPDTWENILKAAQALHDPENKKYGIMIATDEAEVTQQHFQQYALSNGALLFDDDGQPQFNSPEMKETMEYYRELYRYCLPGSHTSTQIRDAMVGENAYMCMYSTYILPALYKQGMASDIGFALPEKKESVAMASFTNYTISNMITPEETDAAKKFLSYLLTEDVNIQLIHRSPGGANPVLKSVASNPEYFNNEVINGYESIMREVPEGFNRMQQFGIQDGKLHPAMGTISQTYVIGRAVNQILVQGADLDKTMDDFQEELMEIVNE